MKRNNPTIKSIVVSVKPFALNIGDILYTGDMFGSYTCEVVKGITNPDAIERFTVLVKSADWDVVVGKERELFPGDLGMPGYAYDDRPCSLFNTREAAQAADGKYFKWLEKRDQERRYRRAGFSFAN